MKKLRDPKLCVVCGERHALSCRKDTSLSRNKMYFAWRKDHDVCQKCWRAIRDRGRV